LTHKGAVGIQGAAFIALVATLMVIPSIPVAGMALILGLDRFMSMCRATVNMLCNGVATLSCRGGRTSLTERRCGKISRR
jgi:aerobic C4-dicarboxylate transport protein